MVLDVYDDDDEVTWKHPSTPQEEPYFITDDDLFPDEKTSPQLFLVEDALANALVSAGRGSHAESAAWREIAKKQEVSSTFDGRYRLVDCTRTRKENDKGH